MSEINFQKTDLHHRVEEHTETQNARTRNVQSRVAEYPVHTMDEMFLLHKHIKYVHLKINKEISFFCSFFGEAESFQSQHGLRCDRTIGRSSYVHADIEYLG